MAATRTHLRGVAGVNANHLAPLGFRLVGEKHPELGEAPGVQAAARFPTPLPGAGADVHQVLHHNYGAGLDGIDNTPAQNVVAVAPGAVDLPGQLAEVPFGRAGAFYSLPLLDLSIHRGYAKVKEVEHERQAKGQGHRDPVGMGRRGNNQGSVPAVWSSTQFYEVISQEART